MDILRGHVGSRDGNAVLASVRETRRTIELGQKIGEHKDVLDSPGECNEEMHLQQEERELETRLKEIRERRGA